MKRVEVEFTIVKKDLFLAICKRHNLKTRFLEEGTFEDAVVYEILGNKIKNDTDYRNEIYLILSGLLGENLCGMRTRLNGGNNA